MFKELIAKIGQSLNVKSIPYMIIGGQAVILYGEPRLTRDIDITLGIGSDKLQDILNIANDLSLKPLPEDVKCFVEKTMVLPTFHEISGIRVDFIFSFTPYEREAISRVRRVLLNDIEVNFASPEDVIIHKIFSHRPRDLEDVKSILLKNPDIDKGYIKRWLSEFDRSFIDEGFSNQFEELLKEIK